MVSSGGGMTDDSDGWELKQTVQVVVGHTFEQTEPASQPAPHRLFQGFLPRPQLAALRAHLSRRPSTCRSSTWTWTWMKQHSRLSYMSTVT